MKKFVTRVLAGAAFLSLGCATVLGPKTQFVPISSTPARADVYIDGIKRGRTPLTLELDPRRSYTLVFKTEGLEDRVFDVRNQAGVGWVILDVLLGVFPVLVDSGTGAWYSLEPSSVKVSMLPPEGQAAGEDPRPAPSGPPAAAEPPAVKAPPPVNCNLAGTEAWKSASALQKKKMLEECRSQQQAQ